MLVQRSEEIAFLRGLIDSDCGRPGGVALLGGSVGTGKTDLLRDLAEYAAQKGVQYLVAAGSPEGNAIPLGIVCQLLHSVPHISDDFVPDITRLDSVAVDYEANLAGAAANMNTEALRLAHGWATTLARTVASTPVLIMVDDADLVDPASLICLHHLAKRLSRTHLAMVFTVSMLTPAAQPVLAFEPIESRAWRRFVLGNMTEAGVAAMLPERVAGPAVAATAAAYHGATGGNPRLVRALIEDDWSPSDTIEPTTGSYFRQAVAACLARADVQVAAVAEVAAVLAASESLAAMSIRSLARMADLEPESVAGALSALDTMGLTEDGGRAFRHPASGAVILAGMTRHRQAELHRRAARQLAVDNSAVSPVRVAVHLVAAGESSGPLARDILVRAGLMLTSAENFDSATRYLELAMAAANGERMRAGIQAMLARTEMRVDPAVAKRHIGSLLDAYKNDHLTDCDGGMLLWQLIWHGMVDEASALIGWTADGNLSHATPGFTSYRRLLQASFPRLVSDLESHEPPDPGLRPTQVSDGLRTTAAEALQRVLADGADDAAGDCAVRVLSTLQLGDDTLDIAEAALETLVFSEQVPQAAALCSELLEEADARGVPLWSGILGSVRAEIALRQGQLVAAKNYATAALEVIPAHGWGAQSGRTLGALVLASTRLDDLATAARHVQHPLPDVTFASRYGAQYLYARGQYYLAARHLEAALADFEFCGRLMRGWEMDTPTFVPWRSGAAAVRLRMRDPVAAERLLEEQIELLDQAHGDCLRSRGLTLLLLGHVRSAPQRVPILREAIKSLRLSGDVFLLNRAMLALSEAHKILGQREQATALKCSAAKLVKIIRADAGNSALARSPERSIGDEVRKSSEPTRAGLTESEKRVASLAAVGHTNREIADQIHITVSTVEQHLTSVYRKLDVRKRADLPVELLLGQANQS
ncbi:AAA family ATPase [Nocardia sp. A7]|uniref:helix-turn-helix transcriptional regulator n=1 Tax=Nocardia sp. A7 TaxID=2789274 RepID=UPI00397B21A6